jgi:TetR/AcrR family transcriptional regulator, regulator of biofilm formation and stress response
VSDRRAVILEATLRVIAGHGADGATHRAVAAEAGVPLASTTYHFTSKDALVHEALALAIDRSIAAVRRESAPPGPADPEQLVGRLLSLVTALCDDDQAPLAAQYELVLEAGRRSELRPLAERWNQAYLAGIESLTASAGLPDPGQAAEILSNLIEGALLTQLSVPQEEFTDGPLRAMLERTVDGLVAGNRFARDAVEPACD